MTFFYDLNKKLDSIREKPEVTHGQLNERDMSRAAKGYEKYGKEGMQALAKAGREGKALDPVRAKYDKYDKDQVNELSTDLLKRARDKAGMKYAQADDRRDQKASDKYNRQDDKFNSALRKKQKDMNEGEYQDGPNKSDIPAFQRKVLEGIGAWIAVNKEAIYASRVAADVKSSDSPWVRWTANGKKRYAIIDATGSVEFDAPESAVDIKSATVLGGGAIAVTRNGSKISMTIAAPKVEGPTVVAFN